MSKTIPRIPRIAAGYAPPCTTIVRVERMSRAFTKYHLDDGRALHRFRRGEPHADPHDHPWSFETEILAGGYVEEVFHIVPGGGWRSELVHRSPGTVHKVPAEHIHRIVELPQRECWTVVRAGPNVRGTRFWRFGDDVRSRAWNKRRWQHHG
ncbi:hypothetical protein H5J25_04575 [Sphingomonas aliaeris]|uniref:Cupin domain-containing protein n=1 Tax=Sphingomonas aliaeris TaxID=2759526 RepID=A0A974NW43_9SPHN|nr:hypothetical protein H5J25_04575 [Sphingomonas aliaeris]